MGGRAAGRSMRPSHGRPSEPLARTTRRPGPGARSPACRGEGEAQGEGGVCEGEAQREGVCVDQGAAVTVPVTRDPGRWTCLKSRPETLLAMRRDAVAVDCILLGPEVGTT